MTKVEMGTIYLTKAVTDLMIKGSEFEECIIAAVLMFQNENFGEQSEEDLATNESEGRLMGVYETPEGEVWIIREFSEKGTTTILFPSDY